MLFTFILIMTVINLAISVYIYHSYTNDDNIPNLDPYKDLDMNDLDALKEASRRLDETNLAFRLKLYQITTKLEDK